MAARHHPATRRLFLAVDPPRMAPTLRACAEAQYPVEEHRLPGEVRGEEVPRVSYRAPRCFERLLLRGQHQRHSPLLELPGVALASPLATMPVDPSLAGRRGELFAALAAQRRAARHRLRRVRPFRTIWRLQIK
eukprot:2082904-Pleurochrysis_carterae.AAC.4